MPFCEQCGSEISSDAKFCGNCGAVIKKASQTIVNNPTQVSPPYNTPPSSTQIPPLTQIPISMPQATDLERVIGAISLRIPKSFGRWDSFTGVITDRRMIFAQMSNQMIQDAVITARNQAKAEGKGFLGQWEEQLRAQYYASQRYLNMQPSSIISETPGNFEIANNFINEIELKFEKQVNTNNTDFKIEIKYSSGKYEFIIDENDNYIKLLKQVYGQKVKTPLGYLGHGITIGL